MTAKKPLSPPPHLYEMAKDLMLERRLHPRVKLPLKSWPDFSGPKALFEEEVYFLHDVSEGGICLQDNNETFKGKTGQETPLNIQVGTKTYSVACRFVGSNVNKHHIQFINPDKNLVKAIRGFVQQGIRGQWLRRIDEQSHIAKQPIIWSSVYDDGLLYSDDPRWQYKFFFADETFHLSKNLWPVCGEKLKPIPIERMDQLLIALENLTFHDDLSADLIASLHITRRRSFEE